MFVKVGEYTDGGVSYLRLVDNYACKVIDVRSISRRRYNIINEGFKGGTSGVMVVGLNSAARVQVMFITKATDVVLYYLETGKFEVVSVEKYQEMSGFLNIIYDINDYARDVQTAVELEHKHVEQMFASFLPQCSGSMQEASVLKRLDRAFLAVGYWTLDFGGQSYTLCHDEKGILRIKYLNEVQNLGLSPFVIIKGREELTEDLQTVSDNVMDLAGINMKRTRRVYLPDYVTRTVNIGSVGADGDSLCIGVRGILFDTRVSKTIGVEALGGVVTAQGNQKVWGGQATAML